MPAACVTWRRVLVTGEVKLTGASQDKGAQEFAVETAQSPFLSLPGAVGIGLALFVLAYAESLLRSLRRGRRKVTAPIGLTIIGAVGGLAAVIISWLAGAAEPTTPTVLVCALLGAGAGRSLAPWPQSASASAGASERGVDSDRDRDPRTGCRAPAGHPRQ